MKRILILAIIAIALFTTSSCGNKQAVGAGLGINGGISYSTYGGVQVYLTFSASLNAGAGSQGWYFQNSYSGPQSHAPNTFVVYVYAYANNIADQPVCMQDGSLCFDPVTGQQFGTAKNYDNNFSKFAKSYHFGTNYTGWLAVVVQREAFSSMTDPITGAPVYAYNIIAT